MPLLVAGLALLWGTNFAWIKVSLEGFTPTQVTLGRMALGAFVLLAVIAAQGHRLPRGRRVWLHLVVAALIANAIPYYLFAYGETRVDSSVAGIANATTPLWTLALVAALRQGEAVTARRVAGFVLGLGGCLLLLAPWEAGGVDPLGAAACVAAALSYAVSFVYMARHLTPLDLTPTVLSAAQLVAATGWTLLALVPAPGPLPTFEARAWIALAVLGILGTGAAYVLSYALLRASGPASASTVTYLFPVVSIAFGTAFLAETPTVTMLVGAAIILAGVALSRRQSGATTRAAAE